jgi:preprotein translocase subunit Sec63
LAGNPRKSLAPFFEQVKVVLAPADKSLRMSVASVMDYYEVLQISPNAELDTANRVYRLLAQRFHPDRAAHGRNVGW